MKDLSEQELDDFFQKSLGKKQIAFNPKAWEKMEAKLEAEKKKRLLYKRLLLLLMLLLTTFGIGYIWEKQYQDLSLKNSNRQLTKSNPNSGIQQQITDNEQLKIGKQAKIGKEQKIRNNEQQNIKETNNGVAEMPNSNDRQIINNQLSTFNQFFSKSQQQRSGTRTDLLNQQKNDSATDLHRELLIIDSIIVPGKSLIVSYLDTPKKQEIMNVVIEKTQNLPIRENMPFGRLNVGILLSPDWSSVGFKNIEQTGYKLGLGIEYQIVRRLSLSTGLIFSRLLYSTKNSEYTVPKGFWTNQIKPEKIWGACEALEIPINLHYALFANSRQKFFVSAGISSYWMLTENYNFEYDAGMPTNLVKGWESSKKSTYYWGIANFSVGYAGKLSKRFFWQVEPFVKLPLNSIGWGKVDLSSTGVFFGWKYILMK